MITAPLGSTTVTRSVAPLRVCADAAAATSMAQIARLTVLIRIYLCALCDLRDPPDLPDLSARKRVRLERRIDLDRLARHLLDRLAVNRSREVMRQLQSVHGLVVVDEERDLHRLRRRLRGGGVARGLLGAAHPLGIGRALHRLRLDAHLRREAAI